MNMIEQSRVTEILKDLLAAHGLDTTSEGDWFIPNEALPAIRSIWHEVDPRGTGRLDVQVLIADGVLLEESFAGIGEGIEALHDAFQNFATNSLHVLLAAFWQINDPEQLVTEQWNSEHADYTMYSGHFGTRGSDGIHPTVPEETHPKIMEALNTIRLTDEFVWGRCFFCNIGNADRVFEALLNNEPWAEGEAALKSVAWPESDGYYSVRHFFVLRKTR